MLEEFGAALRSEPIQARPASVPVPEKAKSTAETEAPDAGARPAPATTRVDPFAGQQRLVREPEDPDIPRVEYELHRGRVYRIRWQLAERFERPIMASLVAHLTTELGKPYYDQQVEGKFGTGRATLRRAAWQSGTRNLEVRQLNPLVGGPVFLTLSDQVETKAIVRAGGTVAPEPDSIGPWWQGPLSDSAPLTAVERRALLAAFDAVLARVEWENSDQEP